MPLPLLIGLGISFGCAVNDMIAADHNDAHARQINYEAFRDVEETARKAREEQEKTAQSLLKLSKRKKGIMEGSLPKFVATFRKVAKINFNNTDFDGFGAEVNLPTELNDMQQMVNISGMGLSDKQLLSTLVFNGFIKGTLGAITGTIRKESEINLHIAYMNSDVADAAVSHNRTVKVGIVAIGEKAERFSKLLGSLNALFVRNISYVEEIVDKSGMDRTKCSSEDKKAIMNCLNFAKAIKDLLEQPLFEADGAVSQQAIHAMEIGETYMMELQKAVR